MTLFVHVSDNLLLIYIVVGVVCTVLALLVAAILYLIRAKQSKGKETKHVAGKQLLPTPFSLCLEHQCLDAEFIAVLLQLLPKGEDGAELPRLFAGCRESSAWLLLHANACQEQSQTCSLFLVCKMSDTPPPPHLLPSARSSLVVKGMKLQKTADTCLWEKTRICSRSSLCMGARVPREAGWGLCCFLNYFFPKLFLFWQVKAHHLLGKCWSPLVPE